MALEVIDELRAWVAEAADPDEFKRRSAHYAASAKAGRVAALLSVAGTDPDLVVAVEQLDSHPMLLACRGATVDLATGEARHPDPADHLTMGVDVEYDHNARSELFDHFLATTFGGDTDLIAYVQRLLGYCLTGIVHEHILPVGYGTGANGKSTLFGVLQDILGDHAVTAPEGLIIQQGHQPHPERLAVLRGRRVVISEELERDAVLAEGVVKMLTGGDTVSAREMYGDRFNFKPTHKVILVTNNRPRVRGVDVAIWRRLRVVPFKVTIPVEDRVDGLRERLVEEHAPAVLAWLVRGAVAWSRDGLGDTPAVAEATRRYRQNEDVLGAWLGDNTVRSVGAVAKVGDLFNAWNASCKAAKRRPGRVQDFPAALEEHGIEVDRVDGRSVTRDIALADRAQRGSPVNSSNSYSWGTLGASPVEPSNVQESDAPPLNDADVDRLFAEPE